MQHGDFDFDARTNEAYFSDGFTMVRQFIAYRAFVLDRATHKREP